jgi:hypothetical protein
MPTITFNDKLRRNLNQGLFTRWYNNPTETGQWGFRNSIDDVNYSTINLMKGTVPTDFSGLTSPSSRSSDILVTWNTGSAGFTFNDPVTNVDGIARVDTPYAVASASGIATWFWWYSSKLTTIYIQLCGTVGTSGTDVILADTTIISGANYRLLNLKFDVPTEYTY